MATQANVWKVLGDQDIPRMQKCDPKISHKLQREKYTLKKQRFHEYHLNQVIKLKCH